MNITSNGVTGYRCNNCGEWIDLYSYHICQQPQQQYYGPPPVTLDQETKELLKRIADALEKIAGKS